MSVVVALGSFDFVDQARLRALREAARRARRLVIAVAADELVQRRTGRDPEVPAEERAELIGAFFPDARVEVAVSDDVETLVERFGADTVAVTGETATPGVVGGVRMMPIRVEASDPALRNRRGEVLWLPRSG